MTIYKGSTEITPGNLYIGDQEVQEVYVGSTKVWENESTRRFAYGTVSGDRKFSMTIHDISGVIIISGGETFIPEPSEYWWVNLPANDFEVRYEALLDPSGRISFEPMNPGDNDITSITIDDISEFSSLRNLFYGCHSFIDSSSVVFNNSTSHISDMYGVFFETRNITNFPPLFTFESVTDISRIASNSDMNNLVIDAPNCTVAYNAFDCLPYGQINAVYINAPICTGWRSAFQDTFGGGHIEVHMGQGLAVDTSYMFDSAGVDGGSYCVLGYLDTVNATNTTDMFLNAEVVMPPLPKQTELEAGGTYEGTTCEPPPADYRFAYGTVGGSNLLSMAAYGDGIVKVVSGGTIYDATTDGRTWYQNLPDTNFEVWFSHSIDWINFQSDATPNEITSIVIDDISTLINLTALFIGCQAFEGDTPIIFNQSTAHIERMANMFRDTRGVFTLPNNLNFDSVYFLDYFAMNSDLTTVTINAPNAVSLSHCCYSEETLSISTINVNAPLCENWNNAFAWISGAGSIYIYMGSASTNAAQMFYDGGDYYNPLCITGRLDTTNANADEMFYLSHTDIPDYDDRQALENEGIVWTLEECPDPG